MRRIMVSMWETARTNLLICRKRLIKATAGQCSHVFLVRFNDTHVMFSRFQADLSYYVLVRRVHTHIN